MSSNPDAASQVAPRAAASDWESPTAVRFLVVGLCVAMSVLLYLDRFAITPATDTMLRELKLSKGEFGDAVGAFFLAYALMQIPTGWLTDTVGARWTLAAYVVCWSLATIGLGFAKGIFAVWLMRLILGVMQAGAYPAAAGLLKRWVPYSARGLANSSVAMGGRAGLLLSLAVTVPLMLLVGQWLDRDEGNWRIVFTAYGLLGVIWAALFVWLYRDRPAEHPWVNAAEAHLIAGPAGDKPSQPERRFDLPVLAMLSSKEVWLMCGINICVNFGWIFLATWLPQFLIETHGEYVSLHIGDRQVVASLMTACTVLAAMCGGMLGGRTTDFLVHRVGRTWGRRLPGMIAGLLVCGMYCLVPQLANVWVFIGAMIAIAFTIDFGLGATWASYQDIGGRHVASVLGCGNMCGNLAAAYFGRQIGYLADHGPWNQGFY
ncbi:MAG: MFS transporter, partial [Planctomycetaceae bacterium]|nr:MFS transporter [Planctomycetaceae bacterium]